MKLNEVMNKIFADGIVTFDQFEDRLVINGAIEIEDLISNLNDLAIDFHNMLEMKEGISKSDFKDINLNTEEQNTLLKYIRNMNQK